MLELTGSDLARAACFGLVLLSANACSSKDASEPTTTHSGGGATGGAAHGGAATGGEAPDTTPEGGGGDEPEAHVFSIQFDYRFDTRGFFDAPERRAALEAAAAQWSAVLDNDFLAVPAGVRLTLKNPENRDEDVVVASLEEQIDDLLVFVGTSEDIPGYGRGGPSSGAESTDATLDKSFSNRMNGKSFQPWAGSISFKGSIDYFFPAADSAERVPKDQYDFISLATHELGHVLGFTASPAFSALEDGATFTGKSAVAAYGRAVPLTEDLGHFEDGTESDGVEALMTPKLLNGIRQQPTRLDLAALHDIGYALK